jgi:hypothetical protein
MKKTLLMTVIAVIVSCSAWAATCPIASLDVYKAALFSCTVGTVTDLTFSGFNTTPSGDIHIEASEITVTPDQVGGEVGFVFSAPWSVINGKSLDSKILYTASCDSTCSINDWVLEIAGAGTTGDGFINVAETSPEVTKGLALSSVGNVINGNGSGTFSPVGSLSVTKDIAIQGGDVTDTSTAISSVTNLISITQNTMTPEPSLLLLCTGFLFIIPVAGRKFRGGSR